jgi:hypothetical protein
MSRHILVKEPTREIVVGFDPPLRAFFGQRFDPSRPMDQDELVAGWPSPQGLGIQPRVETEEQADLALLDLGVWMSDHNVPRNKAALIVIVLWKEWRDTPDQGEPLLARIVREASEGRLSTRLTRAAK